jgi:hypothetical protein
MGWEKGQCVSSIEVLFQKKGLCDEGYSPSSPRSGMIRTPWFRGGPKVMAQLV